MRTLILLSLLATTSSPAAPARVDAPPSCGAVAIARKGFCARDLGVDACRAEVCVRSPICVAGYEIQCIVGPSEAAGAITPTWMLRPLPRPCP